MCVCRSLDNNQFTGTFPAAVLGACVTLRQLSLAKNSFSGMLPLQLTDCTLLDTLQLDSNRFAGAIAPSFSRLGSLRSLPFSSNVLSGSIPSTLGRLTTTLQELHLNNNLLTGALPSEIGALRGITSLCACSLLPFSSYLTRQTLLQFAVQQRPVGAGAIDRGQFGLDDQSQSEQQSIQFHCAETWNLCATTTQFGNEARRLVVFQSVP
jgi:hypothetical protein